jgi:hypothetical protein
MACVLWHVFSIECVLYRGSTSHEEGRVRKRGGIGIEEGRREREERLEGKGREEERARKRGRKKGGAGVERERTLAQTLYPQA